MAYVRRYVPSGIVTEDVLADIEKAKVPLVKIYHYHVNHLGTPQELSDDSSNIVWLSYDRAWGGSFDSLYRQQFVDNWAVSENELQPFKFQGQCLDTETGLHYNRFRYYDSDVGMFISRDPIGLLGGSNVFAYAPNPIGWIDPWGLKKKCISSGQSKKRRLRKLIEDINQRKKKGEQFIEFKNKDNKLPKHNKDGTPAKYTEHDYEPPPTQSQRNNGADRGKKRVVISNDGTAYYTNDHYDSFERIKL